MVRDAIGAVHERIEKVRAFRERLEVAIERATAPQDESATTQELLESPEKAQELLAMARSQILAAPLQTVPVQAAGLSSAVMELLTP
ncbi:MAG: hypothetical protein KatS3mg115_1552 [Candidatus Poribacteria bacterium]|nr:MAG: hypothetical protein KatS3mg115_1552 [Candidatus Poribacteria bacterium]